MVSKASEDFPDPEIPVNTTSASLGSSRWTSRRLCSRAPLIVSFFCVAGVTTSPATAGYPSIERTFCHEAASGHGRLLEHAGAVRRARVMPQQKDNTGPIETGVRGVLSTKGWKSVRFAA